MAQPTEKKHSVPGGDAVGGHAGGIVKGEAGIINKRAKKTSPELVFYQGFAERKLGEAERFFPKFFGTLPDAESADTCFVSMEDLTHGFELPAILDLKIGKKTWGPDATPDKIEKMGANDKKTTSDEFGSRLTGYKCYDAKLQPIKAGKDITFEVRTLNQYLVQLGKFFSVGDELRKDVISTVLPDVKAILTFFQTSCPFELYSASLLFVYDAKNDKPNGRVRLIDFAHVFDLPAGKKDDNFIFGVEKLIGFLEGLVKDGVPKDSNVQG